MPLADSIIAVKLSTGVVLNSYQANPNDNSDLDFGSSPVLTTTEDIDQCTSLDVIGNYVLEAPKNGTLYAVKRGAGGLVSGSATSIGLISGLGSVFIASPGVSASVYTAQCSTSGPAKYITRESQYLIMPSVAPNNISASAPLFDVEQIFSTGGLLQSWVQNPTYGANSSPVISVDLAIYGGGDNYIHAYNLAGTESWQIATTGGQIWGSPAISNGRIYIGSGDGYMYCISPNGN